ncbi:hypothetical protein COT48_05900 [Candidatus Woesearchaeota archaeon CG08_land_8_20_14_0_20_47_9]|nr:MAG: hypothetical protein COT48_05900 [Candidatus Woesearchaeota archaeon CG08_land_8_20_14_0_20_47_9]HII29597.1 hypothetical protein [Candidatus Woesearchaeota archaeon]
MGFARFRPNRGKMTASSIEEKIVYDADALQALCPFGMLRLFAEKINQGKSMTEAVNMVKETQKRFLVNLQTKTARGLASKPQRIADEFLGLFDREERGSY